MPVRSNNGNKKTGHQATLPLPPNPTRPTRVPQEWPIINGGPKRAGVKKINMKNSAFLLILFELQIIKQCIFILII
jgi:hypothetical protein